MLYRVSGTNSSYTSKSFRLTGTTLLVSPPTDTSATGLNSLSFLGVQGIENVQQYGTKVFPIGEYGNCFVGKGWSSAYQSEYKNRLVYTPLFVDDSQLPELNNNSLLYSEVFRKNGEYLITSTNTVSIPQQVATYYVNLDNTVFIVLYISNVEVDGVEYDYIVARYRSTRGYSSSSDITLSCSWNSFNRGYRDGQEFSLIIGAGSKIRFKNSIIDDRLEALFAYAEEVPPYKITIYNYKGDEVVASRAEIPAIKKVLLVTSGDEKFLTLTGVNDTSYSLQWETPQIEGKNFVGLSTTPNSNRAIIYDNVETIVSWVGDIVLYEAYGTYRPPATSFDINLYKNSAEVNRVDKGMFLEGVGTLSGALRDECSLITPSIVYQSPDVPTFNYVYIPIFNRYYYVTSLSSVGKNVWRMELNCDVLMTYKDAIFMLQGVVGRQENEFNPLLVDTEIPAQSNPIVQVIDIPSDAFNTQTSDGGHNFLMTVIGA